VSEGSTQGLLLIFVGVFYIVQVRRQSNDRSASVRRFVPVRFVATSIGSGSG
jgi:hypothetical protein